MRRVLVDRNRGHKVDRLIGHRTSVGDVIDEAITAIDSGRRPTKGRRDERYRLVNSRKDFAGLCATALEVGTRGRQQLFA